MTSAITKCNIITSNAWTSPSIVNNLAAANQSYYEMYRDSNNSIISTRELAIASDAVTYSKQIVNDKYSGNHGVIDNITWDDYTKCASALQARNKNGDPIYDNMGNPVYNNMTRDDLYQIGYKPNYKYFANASTSLSFLSRLNTYVPIYYDIYAPPEIIILLFFIFIILLAFASVIIAWTIWPIKNKKEWNFPR